MPANDPNMSIDDLAKAIDKALKSQSSRDQTYWGDRRSAAQRAADMKKADQTQKSLIAILTKLRQGQQGQNKTMDDLSDVLEATNKANRKAMDAFGHNFERAQKEFVKALNDTLSSNKGMTSQLKALAGSIEKMEDVIHFDDLVEVMHEISGSIEDAKDHQTKAKGVLERILKLQEQLDKQGTTFEELNSSLKDFDKIVEEVTRKDKNGKRSMKEGVDEHVLGQTMKEWLNSNKITQEAIDKFKELSLSGIETSAKKSEVALNKHASILGEVNNRFTQFAEKTFTAAAALDLLIKAAGKWYASTKTAYGTGTEKGFFSTFGRDARATFGNGIDAETMQDIQHRDAMSRSNMGRASFDRSVYSGINELTGITGDRNEAAKLEGSLINSMSKANIGFETSVKTVHQLNDSFLKLQYQTGMNAEEFGQMNDALLSDGDIRRQMLNLSDRERAAMLVGIDKRIQENVQIGYSIDQTKEQISLLNKLFDPLDPKKRYQNSVKTEMFMRTQGMGGAAAHDVGQIGLYGSEQYKKTLMSQGLSEQAANARIAAAQKGQAAVYSNTQKKLAGPNLGLALQTQGLMDGLGQQGVATSDAWLHGTPQTGEAQGEFKDAVGDFQKAVSSFSGDVLSMGDRLKAAHGSTLGMALEGGALYLIARRLGIAGVAGNAIKAGLRGGVRAGGQAAVSGATGLVSKGLKLFGGGAAEAAAPAGIELVNGIPRAAQAAKAVAGGVNLMKAGKIGLGLTKGLAKGLPGLGIMLAQDVVGDKSTAGKILNSNTVNGALWGSTIGSIVPGVGTAIGAGVGGLAGAGMDAWSYFHDKNGKPVKVATPHGPAAPNASKPSFASTADLPPLPVNMTDKDFSKLSAETWPGGKAPKSTQDDAVSELKKQNDLLGKILNVLKDQTSSLNDNSNKSMSALEKLKRAVKQAGANADSDLAAAAKYN